MHTQTLYRLAVLRGPIHSWSSGPIPVINQPNQWVNQLENACCKSAHFERNVPLCLLLRIPAALSVSSLPSNAFPLLKEAALRTGSHVLQWGEERWIKQKTLKNRFCSVHILTNTMTVGRLLERSFHLCGWSRNDGSLLIRMLPTHFTQFSEQPPRARHQARTEDAVVSQRQGMCTGGLEPHSTPRRASRSRLALLPSLVGMTTRKRHPAFSNFRLTNDFTLK